MRFRIVKSGNRYFPQVFQHSCNGESWFDDWKAIGDKKGYNSIKGADFMCLAYRASKAHGEVIKEFEL